MPRACPWVSTKKNIGNHKIELIRNGGKGIKAIEPETIGKNKVLINEKLFDYVCKKYEENKKYNLLERPIFKVIDKIINLALVNHFPVDRRTELENKEYIKKVLKNQPKITQKISNV